MYLPYNERFACFFIFGKNSFFSNLPYKMKLHKRKFFYGVVIVVIKYMILPIHPHYSETDVGIALRTIAGVVGIFAAALVTAGVPRTAFDNVLTTIR